MITRAQKARLGVFLFLSGLVALSVLGVLVGLRINETFDSYQVRYKVTVSGLEDGAPVKYNGVRLGKVAEIKVNPDDVSEILVVLELVHGTPIKKNVRAVIKSVGITGLKYVELTLGSNRAPTLAPGSEITAGESDLDFLTGKAQVISERIDILLGHLNVLTREENLLEFDRILRDASEMTGEMTGMVREVRERVSRLGDKSEILLDDLHGTLDEANISLAVHRAQADRLLVIAERFLDPMFLERVTANTESLLKAGRRLLTGGAVERLLSFVEGITSKAIVLVENLNMTVLQSQDDINRTLSYLLETVENLNDFSRMLKEDPSVLIRGAEFEEKKRR
jgi:phospholipid/cholesterol/gamma-HCH transport system substrate-binding protein